MHFQPAAISGIVTAAMKVNYEKNTNVCVFAACYMAGYTFHCTFSISPALMDKSASSSDFLF